ncbi:uncharacterized protein LOC127608521 [Hippocampus zosterae]|uniref:uncharacterized protein LOC127608521 n=1 Tax=Hippocampus zosterae TaxID=109293 RepID=UPI00223D6131|nr:uncharacterized protein LOC127608521 [Hippocampus zosterae]
MLACCFMILTFLDVSTYPGIAEQPKVLMVAGTIVVIGHPQAEMTVKCSDNGNATGVVVYWHTPFGPLFTPGLHTKQDPVHMSQDGSLVVHDLSDLHQGLYYCLLQHDDGGSELFPYQLHMHTQDGGRGSRFRRGLEKQDAVSDELFTGAVTMAVLLTFIFGFSAGALSRTNILRCMKAVTKRLPSARQHTPDITMTPLTSWPSSPSSPSSLLSLSSPPAKPQRSFRDKQGQDGKEVGNLRTTYLEACNHVDDREGRRASGGGIVDEKRRRCKKEQEENVQEDGSYNGMMEKGERGEGDDENGGGKKNEDDRKNRNDEDVTSQSSQSENADQNREEESSSPHRPSRVIRVYQYDQDGLRYGHLSDPDPNPLPKLKQRSVSLTHLNAIMAAASSGPMDATPQKMLFDGQF